MEVIEVEKALKSILDTSVPLEKKRKKRALRFFHFLVGGESPLEAVELALRRDPKLQQAQLKTVLEIYRLLKHPAEATKKYGIESQNDLVHTLFHCNILYLAQRLLRINLPDDIICDGIPWKAVYSSSISIIQALLDFSESSGAHVKSVVETDTVEILLDYCDGSKDILTTYPAVTTLKSLCLNNCEACERVIFSNGLSKIGNFILKDNCQKQMFKLYHQGLKPYQTSALQEYYATYEKQFWPMRKQDVSYNVIRMWGNHMQMCCALIILKIADQNDRHRKIVFKDKIISKALIKWLKTPAVMGTDCDMIEACVRIIAILCLNEEVAWQLIAKYNLVKYLCQGVHFAERNALTSYLKVVLHLSAHIGRCREAILESEEILQSLSMYVFSFHSEVQEPSLCALDYLVEPTNQTQNLISAGLKPATLILLTHFYENNVGLQIKAIKQCLSKYASREWKQEEIVFGKTRNEFLQSLDSEQAKRLKDAGNEKFKDGEYQEAIDMYSKALRVCPPAVKSNKDGKQGWKWWVLPAVLYSNRAQCYLKTEEWSDAARDCSNAIARCLEDGEEAGKILKKTAYRRAKALLELGIYHTALNDVAFSLRKEYQDDNIKTLYTEILLKYRKYIGPEPIRRCGMCMGGEGEKLKRCANCLEVYCSRECQLQAWENGHKAVCNSNP